LKRGVGAVFAVSRYDHQYRLRKEPKDNLNMKITRLRDKLLLGAVAISLMVALASMLAVSWVIRQQFLDQSNALLRKAARLIDDSLLERKDNLLTASHQLATQKNLGSTIWYLTQYAESGIDRETLFNTYQQLVKDTYKLGRVAKLSKVALYDSAGNLVSFASFGGGAELVGFVERFPSPVFQVATLKEGEELSRQTLRATKAVDKIGFKFGAQLPQQESVQYAVADGLLVIESFVPIMGVAFDPTTGLQETKQLGLVDTVQPLDQAFVDHLSRLTDIKINLFTPKGLSSGGLTAYQHPDWGGTQSEPTAHTPFITFNEVTIDGEGYYQCLMRLYANKTLAGTVAALQSKEIVRKNTLQMIGVLGLIAAVCLLFMLPFAWYFAASISYPLTVLSHIFRRVASGGPSDTLSGELRQLEKEKTRTDELGDLSLSFIVMDDAIRQKIQQIEEINASLEQTIEDRTQELRLANAELTKLAMHDALTGLPNRTLLSDRLRQSLVTAMRNKERLALMYIDLDEFKPINDTHGHAIGDLLLKEAANRIRNCIRESDTVARMGGDEFMVLLPVIGIERDAQSVAEKIRIALNEPFIFGGVSLRISASTGIAIYPEHGGDEHTLLKHADEAMYGAKQSGRNAVRIYHTDQVA
jgi:diguanylate cyclase (GGDEF)-like protein